MLFIELLAGAALVSLVAYKGYQLQKGLGAPVRPAPDRAAPTDPSNGSVVDFEGK